MTREDIIRMARLVRDGGHWNQIDIVNFGLLVAAAEREACAKVAETVLRFYTQAVTGVPEAIRARGEE